LEQFLAQARDVGFVLCGQSADLAPADGLLYALRDVTATVSCLPRRQQHHEQEDRGRGERDRARRQTGQGAFMKTIDEARALAA
jgi:thymidine phosphorylase